MECKFCKQDVLLPCMNTRDMEDLFIVKGSEYCFEQLEKLGGGERGIERVQMLRAAVVSASDSSNS